MTTLDNIAKLITEEIHKYFPETKYYELFFKPYKEDEFIEDYEVARIGETNIRSMTIL